MELLIENPHLCEAFRRGERAALTRIYREYAPRLFELLRTGFSFESGGQQLFFRGFPLCWQRENAVQEVFVRAFATRARQAYDGRRPYHNYLLAIARNFVMDQFRKRQFSFAPLEQIPQVDIQVSTGSGESTTPEDDAIQREMMARVAAFKIGLSPEERQVFDLRFDSGQSIEKTALELGVTEYRVKKTEKRLRDSFLRWMKRQGFFERSLPGSLGMVLLSLTARY